MSIEPADPDAEDERDRALGEVGLALTSLMIEIRRLRGRDARSGDLSFAQYRLLSALARANELPAGQLAAAADVTPATVTQMIDSLIADGIVKRSLSPSDGRSRLASLTPRGRRLYRRKQSDVERRWEDAFEELSVQDLREGIEVLRRICHFFEAL